MPTHTDSSVDAEAGRPSGQVVAKAALLIVVVCATGIGLLTERQKRFEAAHDMTVAHRKADELDREIRELRAEVADRLAPDRLESIEARGEAFQPILWTMGQVPERQE